MEKGRWKMEKGTTRGTGCSLGHVRCHCCARPEGRAYEGGCADVLHRRDPARTLAIPPAPSMVAPYFCGTPSGSRITIGAIPVAFNGPSIVFRSPTMTMLM